MSAKDRLWHRLPCFIWGEGSAGLVDEHEQYTDTLHLIHTRYPRFVCEYIEVDEEADEPMVEGAGTAISIHAGLYRFFHFLFLDSASSLDEVAEVCDIASMCREELDDLDATDDDDEGDERSPETEEHAGLDEGEVEREGERYLLQHGKEVQRASVEFFPAGWRDAWRIVEGGTALHRHGTSATYGNGMEVGSPPPGIRLRLKLQAQARVLLLQEPELKVTAEALWLEQRLRAAIQRRTEAEIDASCSDCQAAHARAMREVFSPGWQKGWTLGEDGRSASHVDGWSLTLLLDEDEPMHLERNGVPVDELRLDEDEELVGEEAARAQAVAFITEHPPEEIALAMTPHPSDEGPDFDDWMTHNALQELFPDGWEREWTVEPAGDVARHRSGLIATLKSDEIALTSVGAEEKGLPAVARVVQAHAVLFRKSPEEAVQHALGLINDLLAELAGRGAKQGGDVVMSRFAGLLRGNRTTH